MSPSGYNPLSALNAARKDKIIRTEARGEASTEKGTQITYKDVLEWVQNKISSSESYNKILQDSLKDDASNEQLKSVILTLLQKYSPPLDGRIIANFQIRIYDDMAGYSLLTPWIEDPNVEEINVFGPGPDLIEIITNTRTFKLKEGFPDADALLDITKRLVRNGKMVIDQSNPRVDSYIGNGIRVSAMISPIIREDKGAVLSIRKQTKAKITTNDLVAYKTATQEELELIALLTRNKISGAIVGATGSGKTTLLNYVLSDYVQSEKDKARVYIIEESREIQLPEDAKVIYTAVYGDDKSTLNITAPDLLKSALRFHPNFICCAEMRGEEAMNAMNAAQTGHIVWSTFHAENCVEAYQRLLTMCKMSGTDLSEHLLMKNLVAAFPIIVSSQQLRDGTRKITGIYEAEDVDGVKVIGHYIYKMLIDHYDYDNQGNVIHIAGAHCRVGNLSDAMAQRIFDNCGRYELVKIFARPGWEPEKYDQNTANNSFEYSSAFTF